MAPEFRVGCSGWSYDDWRGGFYPAQCDPGEYLERYARVFDTVEVDSTFYHTPPVARVRRWVESTREGFRFCPKLARSITHEGPLAEVPEELRGFLRSVDPLRAAGRLGPLVAQFPPTFRFPDGQARLQRVLDGVPRELPLAVELRHRSWWSPEALRPLDARGAALVWSVRPGSPPPDRLTAEFGYVRFIGDRALTEFDRIQRDGRPAMASVRDRLARAGADSLLIYALVNNHFMGFGPGSAAMLREVLGLPPLDLTAAARSYGQMSLAGFRDPPGAP